MSVGTDRWARDSIDWIGALNQSVREEWQCELGCWAVGAPMGARVYISGPGQEIYGWGKHTIDG